jgi:SAM-dependent methyltransferase
MANDDQGRVPEGLVPTLNQRGFMADTLDAYSAKFVSTSANVDGPVLDIGCAYGIASHAALARGASVLACDMERGHLKILEENTPPGNRERLQTRVAQLPVVDFDQGSFSALLCARVFHFLTPSEIRESLHKMYSWLVPGGTAYIVADSPYTGFWQSEAPEYERRKAAGEEFPGFIEDISSLLPGGVSPGMLPYLNPLDPVILARECTRAGFTVEEAGFTGIGGDTQGQQHAGVIARKP